MKANEISFTYTSRQANTHAPHPPSSTSCSSCAPPSPHEVIAVGSTHTQATPLPSHHHQPPPSPSSRPYQQSSSSSPRANATSVCGSDYHGLALLLAQWRRAARRACRTSSSRALSISPAAEYTHSRSQAVGMGVGVMRVRVSPPLPSPLTFCRRMIQLYLLRNHRLPTTCNKARNRFDDRK